MLLSSFRAPIHANADEFPTTAEIIYAFNNPRDTLTGEIIFGERTVFRSFVLKAT